MLAMHTTSPATHTNSTSERRAPQQCLPMHCRSCNSKPEKRSSSDTKTKQRCFRTQQTLLSKCRCVQLVLLQAEETMHGAQRDEQQAKAEAAAAKARARALALAQQQQLQEARQRLVADRLDMGQCSTNHCTCLRSCIWLP